jgi:hypothetical protein
MHFFTIVAAIVVASYVIRALQTPDDSYSDVLDNPSIRRTDGGDFKKGLIIIGAVLFGLAVILILQ